MKIHFSKHTLVAFVLLVLISLYFQESSLGNDFTREISRGDSLLKKGYHQQVSLLCKKLLASVESGEINDSKQIYDVYRIAHFLNMNLADHELCIKYGKTAINIADKNRLKTKKSEILNQVATSYFFLGKYDEALKYFNEALKLDIKNGDKLGVSSVLNNIGKVYEVWGKYDAAIESYREGLKIDKELGNKSKMSVRLSGISGAFKCKGELDSALYYMNEAIKLDKLHNDTYKLAVRYDQLGDVYSARKEYKEALKHYQTSLSHLHKSKNSEIYPSFVLTSFAIVHNHLGHTYQLLKDKSNSLAHYKKSYEYANQANYTLYKIKTTRDLSKLYAESGNYKAAYDYLTIHLQYKDSVFNEKNQKTIAEFKEKYENEKKENNIKLLKKDKQLSELKIQEITTQRLYFIFVLIILFLLVLVIYMKFYSKRKLTRELEKKNKELEELNQQKDRFFSIISHDLRSPISSFQMITSSINKNLDNFSHDTLKSLLSDMNETSLKLNSFLKNLLEWAMTQTGLISPNKEVIEVEQICSEVSDLMESEASVNGVEIYRDFASNSKVFSDYKMLCTVLRNLLSNAIKFAEKGSVVKLYVSEVDDKVKISISNNGPGMSDQEVQMLFRIDINPNKIGNHPAKGSGLGLLISYELIKLNDGIVFVESSTPENTMFTILLPKYTEAY